MKFSRCAQFAGGIALAAAGLAIFFQKVDIHKLGRELISLSPMTVALIAVLALMTLVFRAWRWKIMLPHVEKASNRGLFPIVCIGFMINNILPARLGEAARIMLLWKKNGYPAALSIGSIILERIFDTLAFMSCFFIPVFFLNSLKNIRLGATVAGKTLTLQTFAILFGAIFMSACLAVFLYARFPKPSRAIAKKLLRFVPHSKRAGAQTIGSEILTNLNWVFSVKKVGIMIMHTYGIMICYAVMIALLAKTPGFSILHGLFSQAFAAMGAAIPLAPGYVGTLHAVLLQGLLLGGLSREKAIAAALLYHAIPFCTITIVGLYYFFRMRLSFKDISKIETAERH